MGDNYKPSLGFRMESILKRLEIPPYSYVNAAVLDENIERARDSAKRAVYRKINNRRFQRLFYKSDEARILYVDAVKIDINKNDQFLEYIEIMEKILDLLGLSKHPLDRP